MTSGLAVKKSYPRRLARFSPGPAVKTPCPTPPRLAQFFTRTSSEKPFVLPPCAWLDFSLDTSCYPSTFTSTQGVSYLISCSILCISPDDCHALPGCSVDVLDHAGSAGLHAGRARCFLPIHEEQEDGYVGCCSTPAIYWSCCSFTDYGP